MIARTEPNFTFHIGDEAHFKPIMIKARYFDKETELSVLREQEIEK
jgi:multiple sugar transport system ATP-binding protein